MTPGKWLHLGASRDLDRHVHSDSEMALDLACWREGIDCPQCPWLPSEAEARAQREAGEDAEKTIPVTHVTRKRGTP